MTLADRIVEAVMECRRGVTGDLLVRSEAVEAVERVLAETPPLDTPIPVDFKARREALSPTPIIEEKPPSQPAVTPDDRMIAAGFYRACSHSYFSLCVECAAARVAAIRWRAQAPPVQAETPPREGAVGRLRTALRYVEDLVSPCTGKPIVSEVSVKIADLGSVLDALEGAERALGHVVYRDHPESKVCDGCAEPKAVLAQLKALGVRR